EVRVRVAEVGRVAIVLEFDERGEVKEERVITGSGEKLAPPRHRDRAARRTRRDDHAPVSPAGLLAARQPERDGLPAVAVRVREMEPIHNVWDRVARVVDTELV